MADATQQVRWRAPNGPALEHCAIRDTETAVTLEGVAIPAEANLALRYRLVADAGWTGLRSAHLTLVGGPTLALRHDGYGGWTDGEGKPRKDLAGILDLWLDATPAPVLLLLRRLGGKPGKSLSLYVARADLASFTVTRTPLAVECVAPGRYGLTLAGDAAGTVDLGADGLMAAWEGRFERAGLTVEAAG